MEYTIGIKHPYRGHHYVLQNVLILQAVQVTLYKVENSTPFMATDKCRKLIFALSRSAKLNCGLSHAVLNTLYMGGILHHLYGALVWTETVEKASYRKMLSRVQN